ncbi:MAG: multicopper oxidase family protein [Planctomycetes bacterium]|nr:multicopper oxidase family protein [Planctomycetota bacterium]
MHRFLPCLLLAAGSVAAQAVDVTVTAAPGTATVEPGVTVNAWLYDGLLPGTPLRVTQGQTLRVRFRNQLPEATMIHWHGQPVPLGMDGVPDISRPSVAPGQEFLYELTHLEPGTYWFHPHGHEAQLDVGLASALIVDPANPTDDPPFDVEHTVLLDDWNDPLGGGWTGHLLNGRSSNGQVPIDVQAGQRLRLRLINVAAVTNYVVALDGHPMTVTHADGGRVQPVAVQAVPLGIGERYDVIVDCNNPGVWSLAAASITNRNATLVRGIVRYVGQAQPPPAPGLVPANLATGSLLGYAQLASYFPVRPITPAPDRTLPAALGMQMGPGGALNTINGEAWPNVTPMQVALGDDVQMTFTNTLMGNGQYHPMHVHGHFFRLLGTAGGTLAPPRKDTILIRPLGQAGSTATVQMHMDNPGRWLLHCHHMMHMMNGMMAVVEYLGDSDGDGLPDRSDYEPDRALPVVVVQDDAARFVIGAAGVISAQWTPGQIVALYFGAPLPAPFAWPPFGDVWLDPLQHAPFGLGLVAPNGSADFAYVLPNDPQQIGQRIGLQALGTTPLPAGLLTSTFQAFVVH